MKRILYAAILVVLVAGVAAAGDFPKVEIFGGYDLLKLGGSDINDFTSYIEEGLGEGLSGSSVSTSKLFKKGFDASITFNVNEYFGIEANFLYNRGNMVKATASEDGETAEFKEKGTEFAFMAGPRFTYRKNEKVTPFAHALFGVNHVKFEPSFTVNGEDAIGEVPEDFVSDLTGDDNGFGMAIGGGIDVNVNKTFAIRLIQADYFMAKTGDATMHNINLAFGAVLRLGGK
jgi:opacity protein-like surface antigen